MSHRIICECKRARFYNVWYQTEPVRAFAAGFVRHRTTFRARANFQLTTETLQVTIIRTIQLWRQKQFFSIS